MGRGIDLHCGTVSDSVVFFIALTKEERHFPYRMMFVLFDNNTTGATCRTGTAYSLYPCSHTALNGIRVARSLVFPV
jgi:hypothetical protein